MANKIIKGLFIAAGVLVGVGAVLCIGGAAAGGTMAPRDFLSWFPEGRFPVEHHRSISVSEILTSDDSNFFPAEEIDSLEIEAGKAEIEIVENSSADGFLVETEGKKVEIHVKSGVLHIEATSKLEMDKIYVEIPEGFEFRDVEIQANASSVEIQRIGTEEFVLEIGAGSVEIGELKAYEADFEVGAGKVIVENGEITKCSADIAGGELQYDGSIGLECDVECSAGNAEFRLNGREEDFNYSIDCMTGNVDIGNENYSGLAFEKTINNHAGADMEIECSVGNITIEFWEEIS